MSEKPFLGKTGQKMPTVSNNNAVTTYTNNGHPNANIISKPSVMTLQILQIPQNRNLQKVAMIRIFPLLFNQSSTMMTSQNSLN